MYVNIKKSIENKKLNKPIENVFKKFLFYISILVSDVNVIYFRYIELPCS